MLCVSCGLKHLVVFQVYSLQSAVFQVVGIEFKIVKFPSQVTVRLEKLKNGIRIPLDFSN